jgi:SAM-dependent methyltransferase
MNPSVYAAMEHHDQSSWYYRGKRAAIRALLTKQGVRPMRVIDIGCGTGRNSQVFDPVSLGSEYIGIEPVEMSFEATGFGSGRVIRSRMEDVSVEATEGQAELVSLIDVLEHVDEEMALQTVKRLLSSNGRLLITVPAYPALWGKSDKDAHHLRRYTPERLRAALQHHGFEVEAWNYYFFFGFLPLLILSWVQRRSSSQKRGEGEGYFGPVPQSQVVSAYVEFEGRIGRYIHWPWGTGIVCLARFSEVLKT